MALGLSRAIELTVVEVVSAHHSFDVPVARVYRDQSPFDGRTGVEHKAVARAIRVRQANAYEVIELQGNVLARLARTEDQLAGHLAELHAGNDQPGST